MTPFTLDKRDTKDPATLVLNKPQNKRRRLDKNPKHKLRSLPPAAPLSLSCRLARAALCPCFLSPARPRSRPCSLASTLRARRSTSSRTNASAWTRTSCKNPRALPLSRTASCSRVLPLSCCLSHVRPLSRRRQAPMADGPDARERGGALYWLTGLGAREATVPPARMAIETATTARAAAPIFAHPLGRDGRRPRGRSCPRPQLPPTARSPTRARMCTCRCTEPSRSLKTVDPTRVHNKESGCHPL